MTEDETPPDAVAGGRMLARRWTIAARFRDPGDYGIPTAPTFRMEECENGTRVVGRDGSLVLQAGETVRVRR